MSSAQHSASLSNHASKQYNDQASFVYSEQYTSPVLSLLDAKPGEKIIDLGCGTGELTRVIKGLVGRTGEVWGVDSSESMVCPLQLKCLAAETFTARQSKTR